MYATVRRYEGVTDPGEMVRVLKEEGLVEDVLRQVPGFVNYGAMDAEGGTFMTGIEVGDCVQPPLVRLPGAELCAEYRHQDALIPRALEAVKGGPSSRQ